MIRTLALSAALLLALCACGARQAQAPQTAQASSQADGGAAAASDSTAQPTTDQTAAAASSAPGATQAADAADPSLEHLAALPADTALPSSGKWKPHVNYDVISPAQPTTAPPGKIEVLEVFWLGCPHCYALEPYIRQWLKTKPDYIDFVRVPVMWGPVHRAHARLFYTLEALGRDDLVEKAFQTLHNLEAQTGNEAVLFSNSDDETLKLQEAWAVQNGIGAAAFAKAYNSFYVNTQLQQAEEIGQEYQVQGVPYIAVDGRFSTDVGKAGGHDQLISLIDFLAAWEHGHGQE